MKSVSILRPAAWAGVIPLVLAMQTALAEPLVYVPLGGEGKILVVDAAKDEIVGTISGVTAVHGLARTPDGKFLIAGSYEEREAGVEAVAKPAGVSEEEHAAHHSAAPAGSKKDGAVVSTLSVVRIADGSIVRRIDVPGAVHHVAVSPNGRFAVVTLPNEDAISVIELASYEVVATVSTGSLPNYAVFSPDGARVYVSNAGSDTISEIDTEGWTVRRHIVATGTPEHIVLSADGATLYVANVDDGNVTAISLAKGVLVETYRIGGMLHGIDLSDDGRTMFVSGREINKLVAIDLGSGQPRGVILDPAPYHITAIRGTGKLYVSSAEEPKIWAVDQNDLRALGEIQIGGKGHQMVVMGR